MTSVLLSYRERINDEIYIEEKIIVLYTITEIEKLEN